MKRLGILILWLVCFLFGATRSIYAQVPSVGQYQVSAGYTSVSGPTDNGALLSFSKQIGSREWLVAKDLMLSNPSSVNIFTAGPRFRPPLSAIWKSSAYFDTSRWYPFVDLNLGAVKDPSGHMTFAYGLGVGLDYQASNTVTLLVIQADYDRSKFFPGGSIFVSNLQSSAMAISSGLKITF